MIGPKITQTTTVRGCARSGISNPVRQTSAGSIAAQAFKRRPKEDSPNGDNIGSERSRFQIPGNRRSQRAAYCRPVDTGERESELD